MALSGSHDELDFKEEKKLEHHLFNIYSVIEAVVVDPQKTFDSNIEAQSRLLTSLQASADTIQQYLDERPERFRQPLPAKEYLENTMSRWMEQVKHNFEDQPHLMDQIIELENKVREKVQQVPTELEEQRKHLIDIMKTYESVAKVALGEDFTLIVDNQKLEDVLTMISDL
jgi:hypothetical protein